MFTPYAIPYTKSAVPVVSFPPKLFGSWRLTFQKPSSLWIGSKENGLQKYVNGNIKTFTTKDGLVNNSISFITQTRDGSLWIGTKGGLSRFENGQFINYTIENGLSNNYIRDIHEDQDGSIWIGTYGGGILRLKNNNLFSEIFNMLVLVKKKYWGLDT